MHVFWDLFYSILKWEQLLKPSSEFFKGSQEQLSMVTGSAQVSAQWHLLAESSDEKFAQRATWFVERPGAPPTSSWAFRFSSF